MAYSVVSGTVSLVLQNLSRLLVDEVKLLSGVEGKISSLRDELKFMHTFLKSSEGKPNSELVKEVVSQITDVTFQAEDVIDTYVVNVNNQRRINMFQKCFHCKDHVSMLHDVDDQIKRIKAKIDEIYKNKDRYGIEEGDFKSGDLQNTVEEETESLRRRRRDVEEEDVVGLVHDSNVVLEKLMEKIPRLTVTSIIGMGGLGKTTLARKVYNQDAVKGKFSCCAWGYVSNDYRAKELFLSLLQCLNSSKPEYKDWSAEQLKKKVKECLKEKKYLVVLDDIWDTQVWDDVKGAFPDDGKGSRILITSRKKEVALYTGPNPPFFLPFLNEKESWELFCKKVFWEGECPSDLEPFGRKMVENCKGLPLAIIVLAGLISKKEKSKREWRRIRESVNWHLAQDKVVMDILKLSYDNLPRKLKPCFLYLGIYPEDYEISARELIKLWVAEGFIQPNEVGTSKALEPEDVGDHHLDELVDRSLVQLASKRSDGGVKTCRIHDLLRDLCISESKKNKFMEICSELDYNQCNSRRLSVLWKKKFSPTQYCQSHSRSLFLFGDSQELYVNSKGWKWIKESFKLARVLHLNKGYFRSTPVGLKTLIHLRYIEIFFDGTRAGNHILAHICNLWNLEILHLINVADGFITIPNGILKLKRLRHVHLTERARLEPPAHMPSGENGETMVSIQTLGCVEVTPALVSMIINDFFPNLTKLCLSFYNKSSAQQLWNLHGLNKLRKLKIFGAKLNFPWDANVFPSNLTKFTLINIDHRLDSGFMNTLGRLSELQILKLKGGVISGPINCVAGDFPQLEVFHMMYISTIGQLRQEKGAMPHLRRLFLSGCSYYDEQHQEFLPYAYGSDEFSKMQLNNDCKVIIE